MRVPHGGVRPFHQRSTYITRLTLGPHVVQIWSRCPWGERNPRTAPCGTSRYQTKCIKSFAGRWNLLRRARTFIIEIVARSTLKLVLRERARERERETDRQTDRQSVRDKERERERERESLISKHSRRRGTKNFVAVRNKERKAAELVPPPVRADFLRRKCEKRGKTLAFVGDEERRAVVRVQPPRKLDVQRRDPCAPQAPSYIYGPSFCYI